MGSFEDDDENGISSFCTFTFDGGLIELGSQNSSEEENDLDETMEDVDDADGDADAEGDADADADGDGDGDEDDGEGENDEDEGDNEDDEDQDEAESPSTSRLQARIPSRPITSPRPLPNGVPSDQSDGTIPAVSFASPSPHPTNIPLPYRPSIRPEALTAATYDIVPTIAAPQSTSINAVTATPDMRWVFTGGTDGYIRKFHWPDSANGKVPLTVAQKHPFVDSVVKAGVLLSYWENEVTSGRTPCEWTFRGSKMPPGSNRSFSIPQGNLLRGFANRTSIDRTRTPVQTFDDSVAVSPVYSLAVHNQALWLLSGTETGGINVFAVRHQEGHRIATLNDHKSAVSVLELSRDERSVLSGSWDKIIHDWDLDTGKVKRSFIGSGGQISAIEPRPLSSVPVPEEVELPIMQSGTFSSNNAAPPRANGILTNGIADEGGAATANSAEDAPADPDDDLNSLFGDDEDAGGTTGDAGLADFAATAPDTTNGIPDASNEAPSMPGLDDDDDEFSRAIANGLQNDEPIEGDAMGDLTMTDADTGIDGGAVQPPESVAERDEQQDSTIVKTETLPNGIPTEGASRSQILLPNGVASAGLPHSEEPKVNGVHSFTDSVSREQTSESTFLSSSFDGSIRIWDRRQPNPIARIVPPRGTPPFCMSACWSPDGNFIYAGRRNNSVEEYSLHNTNSSLGAGWTPSRTFRFPAGSGAVSAVRCMPNGRHLVWYVYCHFSLHSHRCAVTCRLLFFQCANTIHSASYDILRLYDLHARPEPSGRHSTVPFLIVPGHRTGVISQLFIDPTCKFLISTAGNRGWEGASTEVLLGYEIGIPSP